jgi:hypothetical protein
VDHLLAPRLQLACNRRADQPCTADDEDFHG